MSTLNTIDSTGYWSDISATLNDNFNLIQTSLLRFEDEAFKNHGFFETEEALKTAYPNASDGSYAYVGLSEPYSLYVVELGVWTESSSSVSLDEALGTEYDWTKIPSASTTSRGLMTPVQVQQVTASIRAVQGVAITGVETSDGYSITLDKQTYGTSSVALPIASEEKAGLITAQDYASIQGVVSDFGSTALSVDGGEDYLNVVLNKGGYAPSEIELPVHGGDDGETSADTPALLHPADFDVLMENYKKLDSYTPTSIVVMADEQLQEMAEAGTLEDGVLYLGTED